MNGLAERTLIATCEMLRQHHHANDPSVGPGRAELGRMVLDHLTRMPALWRFGISLCLTLFSVAGVFHGLTVFHRLGRCRQLAQWERWKHSRLSFTRDFVRLFESLTVVALYSYGEDDSQQYINDNAGNGAALAGIAGQSTI